MISLKSLNVRTRGTAHAGMGAATLALIGLALVELMMAAPAKASETSTVKALATQPPAAQPLVTHPQMGQTPAIQSPMGQTPAVQSLAPGARPVIPIPANPADAMGVIASMLEKNASHVAMQLEDLPITQGDAADYIRAMPISMASLGFEGVFRQAMDALVRQKAMVLQARKAGLDKDPAVLRKGAILFEKVMVDAWLTRKANEAATEPALRARYDRFIAGQPGPDEVRARVILVPSAAEARALIVQAQNGADFAELARQHSKDPTAAQGGDLGYVVLEAVAPEIGSVMFSLPMGQVTAYPVNSVAGYFIVRIEGRRQRATPTFEESRAVLERAERADAVRLAVTRITDDIKLVPPKPAGTESSKK